MKHLFFTIFFTLTFVIYSQELVKDKWIVEWSELEGVDLSLSNQLLLTSIPTYFMENIESNYNHYPNVREREDVFNYLKIDRERELFLSRSNLIKAKDELLFNNGTEADLEEHIEKIEKIQAEIEVLKKLEFNSESSVTDYEIDYLGFDGLASIKDHKIYSHLKRDNIDYFIGGVIEEELDNLFLTVKLYSKYNEEPVIVWSGVGDNEEILSYRAEILDRLIRIVISDEVIFYGIDTTPKDALIYVDHSFKALGQYHGYTISSETLEIEILKEGYNRLSLEKEITDKDNKLFFQLIPFEIETIVVNSNPSGASVYYGSKYLGVTPINVPLHSYSQKLTISYDGYMDRSIVIDSSSQSLEIGLTKGVFDREENFIQKKKNFYTSTALFSIALALPLYFTSVDGNINDIIVNISIGNAVLFGLNLFYSLYSYLRAAEISVE